MQPYRHYHKLLEDQDAVSTIISVAELLRSEAEGEGDAKTSMNSFINMLKNAGLNIDYQGLKAYYEAEPRLQGQIQDFNKKEIVFVGDEEGLEMKPQGEVPPEEKVAQMAKSATDKRQNEAKDEGASEEEEDEFHRELDKLVHATFGHSSDEKKMYKKVGEKAPPGREDQVKALKKKFPDNPGAAYAIAWSQHNKSKK